MDIKSLDDIRIMKVPQLRTTAKEYGIVGFSKMKKADMISTLSDKLNKLTTEDKPPSPPPSPPAEPIAEPIEVKPKRKRTTKKTPETQPTD